MMSDTPLAIVERMQSLRIPRLLRMSVHKSIADFVKQVPLHDSLLRKALIKCDCKGSYRLSWGIQLKGNIYVSTMIVDAMSDAVKDLIARNDYFLEVSKTYTHVELRDFAQDTIADGVCVTLYRVALDTYTVTKRYYDSNTRYAYTLTKNEKDLHI